MLVRLISGTAEFHLHCVFERTSWSIAVGALGVVWPEFEQSRAGRMVLGGLGQVDRAEDEEDQ